MNTFDKLKEPQVWVLFFSFTKLFTAALGFEIAPDQWDTYEDLFNSACGIAVALGIFHYNPNRKEDPDQ